MTAHFIVNTVEGVMLALCGAVIPPRDIKGARVGIHGKTCAECQAKVSDAWVTVK